MENEKPQKTQPIWFSEALCDVSNFKQLPSARGGHR